MMSLKQTPFRTFFGLSSFEMIAMFLSVFPMLLVPEGGVKKPEPRDDLPGIAGRTLPVGVFTFFLLAMGFINFGRNSIAVIFVQYLVLESGFGVSSQSISYIVNTNSVAIVIAGLVAGPIIDGLIAAGFTDVFSYRIGFLSGAVMSFIGGGDADCPQGPLSACGMNGRGRLLSC